MYTYFISYSYSGKKGSKETGIGYGSLTVERTSRLEDYFKRGGLAEYGKYMELELGVTGFVILFFKEL